LLYTALTSIIESEAFLNDHLPAERLKGHPPAGLMAAAKAWSEMVWAIAEQLEPLSLSAEDIKKGLRLAQNPVFICGVHRSGTTLLRDMLDGHPDLVVLPAEGTYYTNQETKLQSLPEKEWLGHLGREWLRRLANPINQPPYWLLGRSSVAGSPYIDFARYVSAWWKIVDRRAGGQWPHMAVVLAYASCTGNLEAKLWVDKTPTNERFLNRIWQEMPSAKIIHMIREPLATLASHKKMDPSGSFRYALRYLKNSFTIAGEQSALADERFLLLRYEDICNEPKKMVARLALFLGIEPADIMNRPTVAGILSSANSSFNKQAAAGLILTPGLYTPDKVLSGFEQQLTAAYLGELAVKHDYPLMKIHFFSKLYLVIKYRLSGRF
jgi:Sulfotransferase family